MLPLRTYRCCSLLLLFSGLVPPNLPTFLVPPATLDCQSACRRASRPRPLDSSYYDNTYAPNHFRHRQASDVIARHELLYRTDVSLLSLTWLLASSGCESTTTHPPTSDKPLDNGSLTLDKAIFHLQPPGITPTRLPYPPAPPPTTQHYPSTNIYSTSYSCNSITLPLTHHELFSITFHDTTWSSRRLRHPTRPTQSSSSTLAGHTLVIY